MNSGLGENAVGGSRKRGYVGKSSE